MLLNVGVAEIDQIITVLLTTSMAVGCIIALILDNTIPGTEVERGLKSWRQHLSSTDGDDQFQTAPIEFYDLPFGLKHVSHYKVAKYLPFVPYYEGKCEDESHEMISDGLGPKPNEV